MATSQDRWTLDNALRVVSRPWWQVAALLILVLAAAEEATALVAAGRSQKTTFSV